MLDFETADVLLDRRQQEFLERYVFQGLEQLHPSFDAEVIAHFRPETFLRVLERCARFGVEVHGVEMFTDDAEMIHIELAEDGSPYCFVPAVLPFFGIERISVCATYSAPAALLASPAVSGELLDAYATCEYSVECDGCSIDFLANEGHDALKRLLADHGAQEAFIITACRPFSRASNNSDELQTKILSLELTRAGGTMYPAIAAKGTQWEEVGYLILGLTSDHISTLADRHGQNAVLQVLSDGSARVVLLR